MWTSLVAGSVAHDINNLAQGLYNLLTLASAPGASAEALERYRVLAREGLAELRRLGSDLRVLADVPSGPGDPPQRLDLACSDALIETDVPPGRAVDRGPLPPDVLVRGTSAALRTAVAAVLRYCLAASAPGGRVRVSVTADAVASAVVFEAASAPPLRSVKDAPVAALLGAPQRELAGDGGLVLAGAIAARCGGELWVSSGEGGLRFKLSFARAEEGPHDARSP